MPSGQGCCVAQRVVVRANPVALSGCLRPGQVAERFGWIAAAERRCGRYFCYFCQGLAGPRVEGL